MDDHHDKYNDPRAQITARGIAICIGILILACIATWISVNARKTRLLESRKFWGETTITAFQLAETIELIPYSSDAAASKPFKSVIDLTATPGLGHLRRALLDQRHYDWSTIDSNAAVSDCSGSTYGEKQTPGCMRLRFSDPSLNRFSPIEIDLDLIHGWLGPADRMTRVQSTEYVQPKLRSYFATIINVSRLTFDDRTDDSDQQAAPNE